MASMTSTSTLKNIHFTIAIRVRQIVRAASVGVNENQSSNPQFLTLA